jgi:K+-sensing histidine kinase KdpD
VKAKENENVKNLKFRLKRKELEMQSIQYIGKALSSVLNRDKLLILIMDEVTKLMHAERGTLYVVDGEKGELWSKIAQKAEIKEIRLKIGIGIAGYVAQSGETINIEDAYNDSRFDPSTDKKTGFVTRSILCMPIREPVKEEGQIGEIIAVIQILNKIDGIFTEDDQELLKSLVSQIAIALANSRLYSILEDRVNELNLLFNLEKELSVTDNIDDMLKRLLDLLANSFHAENGLILLKDKGSEELSLRYGRNLDFKKLLDAAFSTGKGIVGQVFKSEQTYITTDATQDDHLEKEMTGFIGLTVRQLICVPLLSEKKAIGVIILINKAGEHSYFSNDDKKVLESVASHMALGIENFRLKEEKMKADRLATIGNMMSTIVHDLRTPMNNIYGFVDLMLEEDDKKTREEYAAIVNEQIKILTNMTTDVLDFSKGKTTILPSKHPVDKLIKDFVRFFEEDVKRQGFKFEWAVNTASMVYVDPEKIIRVFMNIMKNALEAMKKGGIFSIIADEVDGNIRFRLQDTGLGIPEEIKDKLFDSFVTSGKEGGTGLGLAIVKKVIDEHKGKIEVDSVQGEGTTFNIYIPKM